MRDSQAYQVTFSEGTEEAVIVIRKSSHETNSKQVVIHLTLEDGSFRAMSREERDRLIDDQWTPSGPAHYM